MGTSVKWATFTGKCKNPNIFLYKKNIKRLVLMIALLK